MWRHSSAPLICFHGVDTDDFTFFPETFTNFFVVGRGGAIATPIVTLNIGYKFTFSSNHEPLKGFMKRPEASSVTVKNALCSLCCLTEYSDTSANE